MFVKLCYNYLYKKEGGVMSKSSLVEEKNGVTLESEFEIYLKKRRINTTYKGIELETEGWQKEIFGKGYKKG